MTSKKNFRTLHPKKSIIYSSIHKNKKYYPIEIQCKVLQISSYYYWEKNHLLNEEKRISLFLEILDIYWNSKGTYGAPRIASILHKRGNTISTRTVSKHMKLLGIQSVHTKFFPPRNSSISAEGKALIHTVYEGTLYLISFIDQFSKKVVGWHLAKSQSALDVQIALLKALKNRKPSPGLIIHSDKGSQFRSKLYRKILSENHIVYSYTDLNHSCDQNPAQESWHATIKKECIYLNKLFHYEDSYKLIFDFIEGFYNPIRIHSSLGYLSPVQFEKKLLFFLKILQKPPLFSLLIIDITPDFSRFNHIFQLLSLYSFYTFLLSIITVFIPFNFKFI